MVDKEVIEMHHEIVFRDGLSAEKSLGAHVIMEAAYG